MKNRLHPTTIFFPVSGLTVQSMGDSDDEFDRRRRDKFRRERSDMERSREREERRRDDWPDRWTDLHAHHNATVCVNFQSWLWVCARVCVQGLGSWPREEAGLQSWSQRALLTTATHQPAAQTHEEGLVSLHVCWLWVCCCCCCTGQAKISLGFSPLLFFVYSVFIFAVVRAHIVVICF